MNSILIAVPTFENVTTETFESIFNLEKIPGVKTELRFVKGYDCAKARNEIAKLGIDGNFDYIFMIDSDIIVPKDALTVLNFWDGLDFISGYYPRKDTSGLSEVFKLGWGFPEENQLTVDEINDSDAKLVQIQGCGLGCAFIKTRVFEKLTYPYFKYVEYETGECLSEDLYFCEEAIKKHTRLFLETKLRCKHVGKKIFK